MFNVKVFDDKCLFLLWLQFALILLLLPRTPNVDQAKLTFEKDPDRHLSTGRQICLLHCAG